MPVLRVQIAQVKNNPRALGYASEELRGDREIVLAAVKEDWTMVQFASDELKNDPEVRRDQSVFGF